MIPPISISQCIDIQTVYLYVQYFMNDTYGTALMQRRTHSRFFVELRACVEQTYFSILTAYKSRNRSRNTKLHQILSSSAISSLQSLVSCPYSILDTTHEMKPMKIILEGKAIFSILKDFLAWHVPPI